MSPTKYVLVPPDELHPYINKKDENSNDGNNANNKEMTYPDFDPWRHTKSEDDIMINFVSKGYYTTPKVNFESISARSSLQESLPKLSNHLAEQFSQVLQIREKEINKIPYGNNDPSSSSTQHQLFSLLSGPGFQLPNRVTLTDQRKDQWLQELSSPYASLTKISKFIPHGLKRRQVLEQCCMRQIPLKRAIWLLKCCYSMEWKALSTKHLNSKEINSQLLKEWTENFIFMLEKLVFEMSQYYNDAAKLKVWKREIYYFLKLLGNCYTLELINKDILLHWLVEFISKIEIFEYLPLSLHILSLFWHDISNVNESAPSAQPMFLVTKISDTLLHKYIAVSHNKSMINDEKYIINDVKKNNKIKESILAVIRRLICDLFQRQLLEVFLFPTSSWDLYKPCLYEITNQLNDTPEMVAEVKKKLELISYRNESLKLHYTSRSHTPEDESGTNTSNDESKIEFIKLNCIDFELTEKLDDNPIDFDWASFVDREIQNVSQIVQLILWVIHPSRACRYEGTQLVAKILLLTISSVEGLQEYVVEDIIWSVVFQISKYSEQKRSTFVSLPSLYKLLNMLITYGIVKVPTYIRKLISSGVLYLPESNDKFFHCDALINLKISFLMKSQYNMVLRNVIEYDATFYEKYNFDQLLSVTDELKQKILDSEELDMSEQPYSIKIMMAEWYLGLICGGELEVVNKQTLMKNFNFFCIHFDVFHHFYKWVEFIVYHQLLADIETLETLMNILLRYGKLFSQFINDHILFTKTFILIYTKILKESDNTAYSVTSFMPFWKFFMKNFSYTLNFDEDLRTDLGSVYEEEKAKVERFPKDKELVSLLNDDLHGNISNAKGLVCNFPEVFQTNLRVFFSSEEYSLSKKQARYMLLLIMNASTRDYNKFIAIYLKRKDFKMENLVHLISYKLLTLEQVQNVLGIDFILVLLSYKYEGYDLGFEYYRDHYVRLNYKLLLTACESKLNDHYTLFLEMLIQYGNLWKLYDITSSALLAVFNDSNVDNYKFLRSILFFGVKNYDKDEDIVMTDGISPHVWLDFTNIWLFQSYTKYILLDTLSSGEGLEKAKNFLFSMIEVTNYSCLCAQTFGRINDTDTINILIKIFERKFFDTCLYDKEISNQYLRVIIEVITFLSQQMAINSPSHQDMNVTFIESLRTISKHFAKKDEQELKNIRVKLDSFLKISIIHQTAIFEYVSNLIETNDIKIVNSLLDDLFTLFEKISFDLGLKLMLYEILSSLKSYCQYKSTTESGKGNKSVIVPTKLLELPPFQVSSFLKEEDPDDNEQQLSLGIQTEDDIPYGGRPLSSHPHSVNRCYQKQWFIYSKKTKEHWCRFYNEPYHCINNYQSESSSSFNNSCLNLSLFDARYEKRNPK
ncbi:hypothetical protein Kpol_1028p28 [Vanderwaltozyma polyspora DSM 70294]|uniref:Mediator of RNA polymerase II transcription subunit 12 n=1 Tax=Vanderwaltozyma polyspora (strain ATCC 22028 / DSM 70294 / BCRC 21397 / CBS 2163 / NBRC 10782 / NRRL Y-8283 / UCD 57-17) TaxID=436907 RepID=A7TFZ8_VANPO|nr:uncharacterized protein Kpol_1028p28 [Vanderwaltozyma polyspora DSM 70294]EDO18755.1 hypothetical protein Kpol_1028p28 [Vanderwaltozyma polyspora DSM 70294]